jgi:hypothetical protein
VPPRPAPPTSALPTVTEPAAIDGYTRAGASANTNPIGSGSNAVLEIELDGTNAMTTSGLTIQGGNSVVRGLVINPHDSHDLVLRLGGNNTVEGNYIGTDATGTAGFGNALAGVHIEDACGNTTGGVAAGEGNPIAFNG